MAKKKINVKFSYDSPVVLTFAIITVVMYFLNAFVLQKNGIDVKLLSPTSQSGANPFVFSSIKCYLNLITYPFVNNDFSFAIFNSIILIFLGMQMEEKYGSAIIFVMILISVIFAGVLNACFSVQSLQGIQPVIFMLIILNLINASQKKKISTSLLLVLVLYTILNIIPQKNALLGIISIAGGLCGSLISFLAQPKKNAPKKEQKIEDLNNLYIASSNEKYKLKMDKIYKKTKSKPLPAKHYCLKAKVSELKAEIKNRKRDGFIKLIVCVSKNPSHPTEYTVQSLSQIMKDPTRVPTSFVGEFVFKMEQCETYDTHYMNSLSEKRSKDTVIKHAEVPRWPEHMKMTKREAMLLGYQACNDMFGITDKEVESLRFGDGINEYK